MITAKLTLRPIFARKSLLDSKSISNDSEKLMSSILKFVEALKFVFVELNPTPA